MYPEQFRLRFGSSTDADSAPADSAAKAQGFANVIGHGNFLLSLKCAAAVLELLLENLNCAVQSIAVNQRRQ